MEGLRRGLRGHDSHTATSHAPWVVVPANKKWFARWVVAATVIDALEELNLAYRK